MKPSKRPIDEVISPVRNKNELEALIHPALRETLLALQIQMISFSYLVELGKKSNCRRFQSIFERIRTRTKTAQES